MALRLSSDEVMRVLLNDPVRKHSVSLNHHRTAISLEDVFWKALGEIAGELGMYRSRVLERIDERRGGQGLTAATRQFILRWVQGERSCGL